jgi:hypothetical protein
MVDRQTRLRVALNRCVCVGVASLQIGNGPSSAVHHSAGSPGQVVILDGQAPVDLRLALAAGWSPSRIVNAVSYGKASTWLPVLELLKSYFEIADEDERALEGNERLATLRHEMIPRVGLRTARTPAGQRPRSALAGRGTSGPRQDDASEPVQLKFPF